MKKTKEVLFPPTIFNINKPPGITSTDVIRHFKRNLPSGFGKIGHFGTLDPFADGVLLVGIAGACRLNEYIHSSFNKVYRATGRLGVSTVTGDLTVLPNQKISEESFSLLKQSITTKMINDIFRTFLGDYWQRPHYFSATKKDGVPLYKLARKGEFIEKEKVLRHIDSIKLIRFNFPEIEFKVTVKSGTYIRQLFVDIAERLQTIGSLESLTRVEIGGCTISKSISENNWPIKGNENSFISDHGLYLNKVLLFKQLEVSNSDSIKFTNGNPIQAEQTDLKGEVWVLYNGKLLGMGKYDKGLVQPKIIFPKIK